MSHSIWGNRFAEKGGYAWHALGKTAPTEMRKVSEMLRYADADYSVQTVPMHFYSPTDSQLCMADQVAIVRPAWGTEPEAVYGYASRQYKPIQNHEIAALLDPMTDQWPVETLGAIRNGADFFVTLDAGKIEINGDEIHVYYFVWNSHDGSSTLRVRITPIRVVCQNTCILGDKQSVISADVRHTQRILAEAAFAFNLVAQLKQGQARVAQALGKLGKIHFTPNEIGHIVDLTYPIKDKSERINALKAVPASERDEGFEDRLLALEIDFENHRNKQAKLRMGAFDQMVEFNDQFPKYAMTAWAIYNGITAVETWRQGGSDVQWGTSVLQGERAANMARGYSAILQTANAN